MPGSDDSRAKDDAVRGDCDAARTLAYRRSLRAVREARGDLRRKAEAAQRREAARERRAERRAERAEAPPVEGGPSQATLDSIAACESGGDPAALGGGGTFRGKYQFMQSTWEAVGGSGDPAAAPEAEQDRRAAMLYAQSGPGQWPVCGA